MSSLLDRELSELVQLIAAGPQTTDPSCTGDVVVAPDAARVGRFSLLSMIGRGGMGTVYAAYDEQLARRVAVKVLRDDVDGASPTRMLREGQALAKLSHPNVVSVFEAGRHGDRFYVAMEYVEGIDLRAWQEHEPRSWQDTVDAYFQAGRGLAAAHAAGLVHRDFKPQNAMIDAPIAGATGPMRVRVLDFGLAHAPDDDASSPPRTESSQTRDSGAFDRVTRTGAMVGTPAYMAPEQLRGAATTHRSDQFSYCVALWEALHGCRPFAGETVDALLADISRGEPRAGDPGRAPGWLVPLLRRGLAAEPEQRWPDMTALLDAIARGRGGARRRWRSLAAIAAVGGAAAAIAWLVREPTACAGIDDELADVWTPARRGDLRTRISEVDVGFAATSAERIDAMLETYATDWISGRRDACEAALVRKDESEAMMLRRLRCLDDRKRAFAALLTELEASTPERLEKSVTAVAGLPLAAACGDPTYLSAELAAAEDPELAAGIDAIAAELAHVDALSAMGDYVAGIALAQRTVDAARRLGHEPTLVAALNRSGQLLRLAARYDEALAAAEDAYEHSDAAARTDAGTNHQLLSAIHLDRGSYDAAIREGRKATGLLRAAFGADDPSIADSLLLTGDALSLLGRHADAIADYREALATREPHGADHPANAELYSHMGTTLSAMGESAEAIAAHRRALEISISAFGPDHPRVASVQVNLGTALFDRGDYTGAATQQRAALAIIAAAFGPDHPKLGSVHANLGNALEMLGDYSGALAEHRQALAILTTTLAPGHPMLASVHGNIGLLLHAQGDDEGALVELREALATFEQALPAGHPAIAITHNNIGEVLSGLERWADALAEHRLALELGSKALPPTHSEIAKSHLGLGRALAGMDAHLAALVELRTAAAMFASDPTSLRFEIGQTHQALGDLCYGRHEYADALAEYERGLAAWRDAFGDDHPRTREMAERVARTVARP